MRSFVIIGIAILLSIGVAQAGDWPMFGHDPSHSGSPNEIIEPPLKLLWEYTIGGYASIPAVSNGVAYVGSRDNNMYALDSTTGALKWKYTTGGGVSSPAVSNGIVYVGSEDSNVYALDATTGSLKWKYTNAGYVSPSPAVSNGVVYVVGSYDNNVYALDAATGSLKWKYATGGEVSSPSVSNGVVYVGSIDKVYALDAATGSLKWKYKTGGMVSDVWSLFSGVGYSGWVSSTPVISDGVVYVVNPKYSPFSYNFIYNVHAFKSGFDWISFGGKILAIILIGTIALLLHRSKKLSRIENFLLSIKKSAIAIGSIILLFLILYITDFIEAVDFYVIIFAMIIVIAAGFSATAYRPEPKEPAKKPAPREKPVRLPIWMEYLQSKGIKKPISEGKPRRNFKISWVILIILLFVIGSIGYTVYQKYSPLSELANCGNNCIDYKKVRVAQYETSVPDIKITNSDTEKLIMDIPIIIRNPSAKDTETVKIDFDVSMEGKHLTKGIIPAYQLPAMQNTTILIKDVVIKYEELGEVLQTVTARRGAEMVREGKVNISMTTDLLIYFPIELFSINIYTFTIPIQIESEVPVDMLKQNEEAKKQVEEKVKIVINEVQAQIKGTLPVLTSTEQESASYIAQHSSAYDGKIITVNGQVIISPNPGNYIIDGNSGIKIEGLSGLGEGFYKLTGIYNTEKNTLAVQNSQKLEGNLESVEEALKLPNPFVAVKVQGLAASPPAFVENKLNSYIAVPGSPIEEIHTYVIYNKEGLYLIVNPHKSPQLNFSEATVTGTLIKTPPDKLQLGKDFLPADFKGIIIANEITQVNPIPATVNEINQNPEKYAFRRVVIDGIYVTGSSKLGYGKETAKEDLRIHLGAGLMGDEFLPEDNNKLIMSIDPVYTDWQIRKGKVTGTVIYPTKEIVQYFAQKGIDEVKELKPVLIVESISEDLVSISIEDLITDLTKNSGQKYNGKVVNITGYALGANVPVKEVAEKVARAFNPGLGEVVKMIPADVNVQGTAIADSPTPIMGQLPLAGLNSELIEKTKFIAGKYNFKVVVTMIDNKPMLFLVHKEELPFTVPTAIPTEIPVVIPTSSSTITSLPTLTPTPSVPTPSIPQFP